MPGLGFDQVLDCPGARQGVYHQLTPDGKIARLTTPFTGKKTDIKQ